MASSTILLLTDASDGAVGAALETTSHVVSRVADRDAAATTESEPEVVVIDLGGDLDTVLQACRAVRRAPKLANVPILALGHGDDIDERIELLEAGVDDVMARPFDPRELEARIEALALRYQRSRGLADVSPTAPVITTRDANQQRLIAVFSPKGGVGATTVAVNVAVALAAQSPDRVALIDLDLQFGQVATHLNMPPRQSVADLARDDVGLRDPGVFQTFTDRHGSGVAVLAAPPSPEAAASISESAVQRLLDTAGRAFKTVVVDAGSVMDARSQAVMGRASDILIVVTPEFPALKAVHAMRELLESSANKLAETLVVLNQIFAREILRSRDIEEALGTKIALTIPYDAFAFLKSVNEGVPVVLGAPRSAAAAQFIRLATMISGIQGTGEAHEPRPRGLGAIFGRG